MQLCLLSTQHEYGDLLWVLLFLPKSFHPERFEERESAPDSSFLK